MVESMGVPVPGETAIIVSSLAASQGKLSIVIVIATAAAAAIVGDNIGFEIGRSGGRALLEKPGPFEVRRRQILEIADPFFDRHGSKAVFFGRWIAGLRVWASWLAGMTAMPWRQFLVWNALGGMGWALCFGLVGYFGGNAVAHVVERVGLGAAIAAVAVVVLVYGAVRWRLRA
jgi:membrane protein DedA with SNARE-associated domain